MKRLVVPSLLIVAAAVCGYYVGVQQPAKRDIIAFRHSSAGYVKRVIGSPGDRIEIRDGVVLINGKRIQVEKR
jgi:signal peptidase I